MTPTVRTALDEAVARFEIVITAAEPALTALDEATGDGDFGSNLKEGIQRTVTLCAQSADTSAWQTLQSVFLDEVGGTSGPLFGLLFHAIGKQADSGADFVSVLRNGLADGLVAIQRVGEAEVGDRTLVDALEPAVRALGDQADIELATAVGAAVDGALSTAAIRARRGRTSYVGDRAIGHPDPGAVGVALLLTALTESVIGTEAADTQRRRLFADPGH